MELEAADELAPKAHPGQPRDLAEAACQELEKQVEKYPAVSLADQYVRELFALRKVSVEPFQGHLKTLFDLEHLPLKGLNNVRALVTLAVFLYNFLAWINLLLERPTLHLKQTLLALR